MKVAIAVAAASLLSYVVASNNTLVSTRLHSDGVRAVHTVNWMEGVQYNDILAQCGDEVVFQWSSNLHDVAIAIDGDCAQITDVLSPPSTSGNVTVVLDNSLAPIRENGEIYFACSVGRHCDRGQKLEFYVNCNSAPAPGPSAVVPEIPAPAPSNGASSLLTAMPLLFSTAAAAGLSMLW